MKSDYRSSEGYRCLGTSRCVGPCLEPLSLTLSLAPGLHPFEIHDRWCCRAGRDRTMVAWPTNPVPVRESAGGLCRCPSRCGRFSAMVLPSFFAAAFRPALQVVTGIMGQP